MNNRIHLSIIITAIAVISTSVLIHNSLSNNVSHPSIFVEGREYHRGEVIASGDAFSDFEIGGSFVHLDRNTEVELVNTLDGEEAISLVQGRIVVNGDLNTHVRDLRVSSQGIVSIVHYSWLDEMDVHAMSKESIFDLYAEDEAIGHQHKNIHIDTIDQTFYPIDPLVPESSSSADFYLNILSD